MSFTPSTQPRTSFDLDSYPPEIQQLIREKLRPLDDIFRELPKRFGFFSELGIGSPRAFLRQLTAHNDFEEVKCCSALSVEPYPFYLNAQFKVTSAYFSAIDRFIAHTMGKTIVHMPRQFLQFSEYVAHGDWVDYLIGSAAPPDADGMLNFGVNCETIPELIQQVKAKPHVKIIVEINKYMPRVNSAPGTKQFNSAHISLVDYMYENHEPLVQIPAIIPTEIDHKVAAYASSYIHDGDTIQLGIGGIPMVVATHLKERRNLKIHSELLTDVMVDLVEAGAVNSQGKDYMDGLIVGTFAVGTDRLYDWLHQNDAVVLLPIRQVNDPCIIGKNRNMKCINCALMVDLHGQVCSDAIGYKQISGIGGQLEFVMGAQLSQGGQSIICLKSTHMSKGKLQSNIVFSMPPGTPVCVPRHYADIVVTEYGATELRYADTMERARALIRIAHPAFRDRLIRQAKSVGLWERTPGFDTFAKRAMFNHIRYMASLKSKLKNQPNARYQILWEEAKKIIQTPNLLPKLVDFYRENKD